MKVSLFAFSLFIFISSYQTQVSAEAKGGDSDVEFQNRVRALSLVDKSLAGHPVTRSGVLARAEQALGHEFLYQEKNASSENFRSLCHPEGKAYWLRPTRLNRHVGRHVRTVPYKWGGYFLNFSEFESRVSKGDVVGDICTCREAKFGYCLVPETVGLDCSGFVSFTWQSDYYVTSAMHKITDEIAWNELKPGDAINKAGSHTMLFKSFIGQGKTDVRVIESSVTCNGVCESIYSVEKLTGEGFVPLRYKKIIDGRG